MKYKRIVTANKRVQYWADGNMTAAAKIPEDVKKILDEKGKTKDKVTFKSEQTVETSIKLPSQSKPEPAEKFCYITGEPADTARMINGRVIDLNREKTQHLTTGEIAQLIREKDDPGGTTGSGNDD